MWKTIKKVVGFILGVLIIIGVVKGLAAYNSSAESGKSVTDIFMFVILGVRDMTIFLVPTIFDLVRSLTGR